MRLNAQLDQATNFREGKGTDSGTVYIDVNPAELSQQERNLIADRLLYNSVFRKGSNDHFLIVKEATLASLLAACRADEVIFTNCVGAINK